METRVAHILKTPIETAVGGHLEDVQVVDLLAPSKKQLKKTYRLQQYITQALLSSQKMLGGIQGDRPEPQEESGADPAEMEPQAVFAILLASDVDIEACFNEFEKLAAGGCVEVNGAAINKIQYEKVDPQDLQDMFASYIANFTLPSVIRTFSNN